MIRRLVPHSDITHKGSLYLRRFFLSPQVGGWQLLLHKICRPDAERAMHDHPWDFASLCLRGGYIESYRTPAIVAGQDSHVAGQLRLRSAEHTHRIDRILGPAAWTLVLTGPRRRTWGFWVDRNRFVAADEYFKDGYGKKSEPLRRAG